MCGKLTQRNHWRFGLRAASGGALAAEIWNGDSLGQRSIQGCRGGQDQEGCGYSDSSRLGSPRAAVRPHGSAGILGAAFGGRTVRASRASLRLRQRRRLSRSQLITARTRREPVAEGTRSRERAPFATRNSRGQQFQERPAAIIWIEKTGPGIARDGERMSVVGQDATRRRTSPPHQHPSRPPPHATIRLDRRQPISHSHSSFPPARYSADPGPSSPSCECALSAFGDATALETTLHQENARGTPGLNRCSRQHRA
ncbi:hypothetical protein CC78DRAFT_583388 [Lojkania enalia]|uniref:Uncharacterized protein n=1 Tax=Lojkania enalia TaxID=147567 RepID=A0A9P4MXU6_9PLEO|nr:hypothetical protein CC78DRAFT_583388 [Didymosphaeria enalia]